LIGSSLPPLNNVKLL
jgi:hypothetical protein